MKGHDSNLNHEKSMVTSIATARGTVTIRPASEEDASAYRDLRLEALRDHPEAFSADYATTLAQPMSFWSERLRSSGTETAVANFLAVHDHQLIGMCAIARRNSPKTRHTADIVGMYVRPARRGVHIAEGLVTACIEWARAHDVKIVKLAVVATNTPAIRCYDRCGFHVYGVEPQALVYDNVSYDELLMAQTT
jgi:RimJ/RimL family protein N-acetyltransferase